MRYTPERITHLEPTHIFCFGSNDAGRHGLGAALTAKRLFGAKDGEGRGITGRCYAIATKDDKLRTLPLAAIDTQIQKFIRFAEAFPAMTFFVTKIGCGLAGYTPAQIAPLFFKQPIPQNVILPEVFWDHQQPTNET